MLDSNNFLSIMLPAAVSRNWIAWPVLLSMKSKRPSITSHAIIGSNHARDIADVFTEMQLKGHASLIN